MKKNSIKFSLFTFLLTMLFIAGSTGITVIIHSCHNCGDFSVSSGIFLAPIAPEDHCCKDAVNHPTTHNSQTFEGYCCHFKIEKLRLTVYNPVEPESFHGPAENTFTYNIPPAIPLRQYLNYPFEIHNKHGGRYLITYNCQYLS